MAAKKKAKAEEGITLTEVVQIEESVQLLSVDFGREDINTIAMKVNEIIMKLNTL